MSEDLEKLNQITDAKKNALTDMASNLDKRNEQRYYDRIRILQHYTFRHYEITGEVIDPRILADMFEVEFDEAQQSLKALKGNIEAKKRLETECDYYYLKGPREEYYTEVTKEEYKEAEWRAGIRGSSSFSSSNGEHGQISYGKPRPSILKPTLRTVMMVNQYDGWSGIYQITSDVNLEDALEEFRKENYPSPKFDNMSDEWWELHDKQTQALKDQGYEGWDFDSHFGSWLVRRKGAKKVEFTTFITDSWKYEE